MNLQIYLKELKRNRKNAIIWSAIFLGIILLTMMVYQSLRDSMDIYVKMFEDPTMKIIADMFSMDKNSFTNLLGYYSSYIVLYTTLLGSIYSIMLTSKTISKEENDKTAEFLLTKPVTRFNVLMSKLLAFFTYLIILNVLMVLTGFICMETFTTQSYDVEAFFTINLYVFLIMLLFGAFGLFISILIKRGRQMMGTCIGIVLATYFLNMISKITEEAEKIGYLSPFKFIDFNNFNLDWWRLLYFIGISFVLIVFSFIIYNKKDILV